MNKDRWVKNRKRLAFLVVGGIAVFFTLLFAFYASKLGFFTKKSETTTGAKNMSIVFEQPRLKVFDDTLYLNPFPDTVRIHYPYFLVVKPYEGKTIIYNMEAQKKVRDVPQVVLDYDGQNLLFNKSGYKTFFNEVDLLVSCDSAYIKTPQEALCITKVNPNRMENKLISINLQTKQKKDVYSSKNLLTAVSVIKGILYVGETSFTSVKNYLTVNEKQIPVDGMVSILYPMKNDIYFASFKTQNSKAQYYLLKNNGDIGIALQAKEKIIFYLQ